jgi:hypothetical protein
MTCFETVLEERLEQLKMNKPKDFIDMTWILQAMEILFSLHTDLKSLVWDLGFPIAKWDEKWIDQYLDDTVNLLDLSIVLNVEISWILHHHLIVQYIVHTAFVEFL